MKIISFPGEYNYSSFLEENVSNVKKLLSIQHSGYLEITKMRDLNFTVKFLELDADILKLDLENLEKFDSEYVYIGNFPFCRYCVQLFGKYEKESNLYIGTFFPSHTYFFDFYRNYKKKRFLKKYFPNTSEMKYLNSNISLGYHKQSSAYKEMEKFKVGGL